MADLETTLSELDPTSTIPIGSLLLTSLEDLQAASGYESYKITAGNVANQFMTAYSFNGLNTTSKNVVGSINEVRGKILSGTLTAGSTSITFSDQAITASSLIDVYNDAGVGWESIAASTGSVTITFEEQASDLAVEVIIR